MNIYSKTVIFLDRHMPVMRLCEFIPVQGSFDFIGEKSIKCCRRQQLT